MSGEQVLLLAGAAFVASLVSGLGGFGGGFIVIIALTPIVGAKAVIPLMSVYAVCGNVSRVYIYRRTINWRLAVQFTIASLPGVYGGATFLAWVPERAFTAFLGCMLLSAIPLRRFLKRISFRPGIKTVVAFGIVFGLVSGAAAGAGMLVIAVLSSMGMAGPLLLGTDAVIGIVNAVTRVTTYSLMGLLTWDLVVYGLLLGIMTFPGAWVASRIVALMGDHLHTVLIELLILAGGMWLIVKAAFLMGPG